jgi:hypothetical protein
VAGVVAAGGVTGVVTTGTAGTGVGVGVDVLTGAGAGVTGAATGGGLSTAPDPGVPAGRRIVGGREAGGAG